MIYVPYWERFNVHVFYIITMPYNSMYNLEIPEKDEDQLNELEMAVYKQ